MAASTKAKHTPYTLEEIATHNTAKSLWIIIGRYVHDVTAYHKQHPGGAAVMLGVAGGDGTAQARSAHKNGTIPANLMMEFRIGVVKSGKKDAKPAADSPEAHGTLDVANTIMDGGSMLYNKLGGEQLLNNLVEAFFDKLQEDWRADAFFEQVDLEVLKAWTAAFLCKVVGGPYSGPNPSHSKTTMEFTKDHLGVMDEALIMTLAEQGVPTDLSEQIVKAVDSWHGLAFPSATGAASHPAAASHSAAAEDRGRPDSIADEDVAEPSAEEFADAAETPGDGAGDATEAEVEPGGQAGEGDDTAAEDAKLEGDGESQKGDKGVAEHTLEELHLPKKIALAVKHTWSTLCTASGSREAVGEAIFDALFYSVPSLQVLFKNPKAVTAMKFALGLTTIIGAVEDPKDLLLIVSDLGFRHLMFEITLSRIDLFRDAIIDLLEVELADSWSQDAFNGWTKMMNYCAGAMMYIKYHYADQLVTLSTSWDDINARQNVGAKATKAAKEESGPADTSNGAISTAKDSNTTAIPTSFDDMLQFNATVMGCSNTKWLNDVLVSFDAMVTNVANNGRLQEECEIVALKLSKYPPNVVDLSVFKACMLASLRSLLPRRWDSAHEVAWSWLWENVEKILSKNAGVPQKYQKALEGFMGLLDDAKRIEVGKHIYKLAFEAAPSMQYFFKQSNSRLFYISDKVLEFTMCMYQQPTETVNDLCALGLRHVGYDVPVDYFAPFVTACVDVVRSRVTDTNITEGFLWSLSLVAKIMVRTITEGRTVVMMAINANSARQLVTAAGSAPRKDRTTWVLRVQVGTQKISPLIWAIERGYVLVAEAILADLLTIRADRDRYYFGLDELFERHPDIIKRLTFDAPTLLPVLLKGLVWRSRHVRKGQRRVNYYVSHFIKAKDGSFSDALRWLVHLGDPKLICHPVLVMVSDTLWSGLASRQFITGEVSYVLGLLVFVFSQAFLPNIHSDLGESRPLRYIIMCGRILNYLTMLRLFFSHGYKICLEIWTKETTVRMGITCPKYLTSTYNLVSILLTFCLILMFTHEPLLYCQGIDEFMASTCDQTIVQRYSIFSMCSMVLFWLLIINLSVFSTSLSAFVLVGSHVMSEVGRFLAAICLLFLSFGTGVSCLSHSDPLFADIPSAILSLFAVLVRLHHPKYEEMASENPALLGAIGMFMAICSIILLNLLISQLKCSYKHIYADMLGLARLHRIALIVKILEVAPTLRWNKFVASLKLEHPLELNDGDLGPAPGIQRDEPANQNSSIDLLDAIVRYGGDTDPLLPWPEDTTNVNQTTDDRLEGLEVLIKKILRNLCQDGRKGGGGGGGKNSSNTGTSEDHASEGNFEEGSDD